MAAFGTFVEVEMVGAVEEVETVEHVLACMRMNDVQEDGYSHTMGSVDKLLQLFRRAIPRTRREEISDLITKSLEKDAIQSKFQKRINNQS